MRRSELSTTDLENLQHKITAANELLGNLQTEIKVVQSRRETLRLESDDERSLAVTKRKSELSEIEHEHGERLQPLQKLLEETRVAIAPLERQKATLESEIPYLQSDIEQSRASLIRLTREVDEATVLKEQAQAETVKVRNQIGFLTDQIAPLVERQAELLGAIRDFEVIKDDVESRIATLDSEFSAKEASYEQTLARLQLRSAAMKTDYATEQQQMELARKQLADREIALNARDDNLRRREFKVERDEQRLAQNAGLLNL